MAKKIYKTMQGREVDLEAIRSKNELTVAVGNVQMNARGDQLGKGGKVIKKREEVVAEYYEDNPNAAVQQNIVPSSVNNVSNTTSEVKKKV
jgi:hypothetical protein